MKMTRAFFLLSWLVIASGRKIAASTHNGKEDRELVRGGHLRPVADTERHSVLDEKMYSTGHSYIYGKGKGGKKSGYYSDDEGKGGKKGKKSKGSKKHIDYKLKRSGDENDDDWWEPYYGDEMDAADHPTFAPMVSGDSSLTPSAEGESESPSVSSSPSQTPIDESSSPSVSTVSVQQALLRAKETGGHVGAPRESDFVAPPRADVIALRASNDGIARQSTNAGTGPRFEAPLVERELFPDPVYLKAHSSVFLKQHDGELFSETTNFLTPCLERTYLKHLQAYKLTVDYDEGPDVSDVGLVITHMNIKVVLSIITDSISKLRSLTHEGATEAVRACFEGPLLYQYLGALRMGNVDINEIAFLEDDFRAPIFANNQPISASAESPGQQGSSTIDPESQKSRLGLVIVLCFGMVAVGAVAFAHQQGKLTPLDLNTDRVKEFGSSIKRRVKKINIKRKVKEVFESVQDSLGSSFGSSDDGSKIGEETDGSKQRERTWSGSFRRHPETGIKRAALSRKGARSEDYMKKPASPSADEYSFSVGADYNVPMEYDFQATPMSTMYQLKQTAMTNEASPITVDEFSMPEDYNTVNDELSLYSRNMSVAAGFSSSARAEMPVRHPAVPRSDSSSADSSIPAPTVGNSTIESPPKNKYDEWSYSSYTSSPAAQSGVSEGSPPYRHWGEKPKDSPGSRLAMPKLG